VLTAAHGEGATPPTVTVDGICQTSVDSFVGLAWQQPQQGQAQQGQARTFVNHLIGWVKAQRQALAPGVVATVSTQQPPQQLPRHLREANLPSGTELGADSSR
jgi:hypothetical protein